MPDVLDPRDGCSADRLEDADDRRGALRRRHALHCDGRLVDLGHLLQEFEVSSPEALELRPATFRLELLRLAKQKPRARKVQVLQAAALEGDLKHLDLTGAWLLFQIGRAH